MAVPISSSPKMQEHERERGQQRGAEGDEDHAQHEREHDADDQHLLLVLGGDGEGGHDDHEDEEVVDRQALLDDVAGEVLAAEAPAGDRGEHEPEGDRDGDVEDRPDDRLAEADLVRAGDGEREVDREQHEHEPDGQRPPGDRHVKHRALVCCRWLATSPASAVARRRAARVATGPRRAVRVAGAAAPAGVRQVGGQLSAVVVDRPRSALSVSMRARMASASPAPTAGHRR